MKKITVMLVLTALVLGLCACSAGNTGESTAPQGFNCFVVGYSRVNIMPTESVPMDGYGNTSMRMSKEEGHEAWDDLYSTCIAFTDADNNTVLLFQNDLLYAYGSITPQARAAVSQATGIPVERIMVAGTHTHSAPALDNLEEPSIVRYRASLIEWMVQAGKEALADRKPAKMYTGTTEVKKLNFVRHYTLDQGGVRGDNFGTYLPGEVVDHTHAADNIMQLVKFTREGGQDVVMVNWQSHPHRGGGRQKYNITADIVGVMRATVEGSANCLFAYYTGGSGNINPSSWIPKENITSNYSQQGKALAKYAINALGTLQEAETGKVQIVGQMYTGTVNHTEDHKLEKAKEVVALWEETDDRDACNLLSYEYGMNSVYHALALIERAKLGETYDVEMYAFSIGDLAFVTAPYEMFDENGKYIKDNSPFKNTFVVSCSNDSLGYIASEEGYESDCYGANTGKFVKGTAEILAQEYVKLLNQIHAAK